MYTDSSDITQTKAPLKWGKIRPLFALMQNYFNEIVYQYAAMDIILEHFQAEKINLLKIIYKFIFVNLIVRQRWYMICAAAFSTCCFISKNFRWGMQIPPRLLEACTSASSAEHLSLKTRWRIKLCSSTWMHACSPRDWNLR